MDRVRLLTSLLAAVLISLVIVLISNDFGITWDEPLYMKNGDSYVSWLTNSKWEKKDSVFAISSVDIHPPFRKFVSGITHEFLTTRLHAVDNTRGYRVSSLFFVIPLITVLTYVAIGQFGFVVGILIPFIFSFLPHVLFLTPLVSPDYAVTALWFISVVSAVLGMKQFRWLVLSGVTVGLTMLTKLHGFLLFIPITGYGLWYAHKRKAWGSVFIKIAALISVAFAVFILGWPWLWSDTFSNLTTYFQSQASHAGSPEYIFGSTYRFAPWWYTASIFLTTTPLFVLIFFAIGAYWTVRKGKTWDWIVFLNALYPLIFFSLPGVVRYDWIRLFLPAYPFVCLVAGRGMVTVINAFKITLRKVAAALVVLLWIVSLFFSVVRIHPWESSYYNELVGGTAGANKLGMETEFWGNAFLGVLPWMNANKSNPMCVWPTTNPFYYYQAMGQIDPGVIFNAGKGACDYFVILMREGLFIRSELAEKVVHMKKPVYTVSLDGVPLVGVYDIRDIGN